MPDRHLLDRVTTRILELEHQVDLSTKILRVADFENDRRRDNLAAVQRYAQFLTQFADAPILIVIDNGRVVKELEKLDPAKTKFRFYLDDGTVEGADDTRRVNVMLRGKGYPVTYVEGETGHNWTAWSDRLADAFVALWK